MATLYGKGKLALNAKFIAESSIGTRFRGKLIKIIKLNGFAAVEPIINGRSYLMGIHQFVLDPNDPVKFGFKIE